jgi:CheY-like chemotaxis protein
MILYFAADLLWATRIKSTGDAAGIPTRPVRSLEMLESRLADSPVKGVVVDLDSPERAMTLIRRMREAGSDADRSIPVVAWGPHVAVEVLAAAREAGADAVLARGAFSRALIRILRELESGSAVSGQAEDQAE